MQNGGVFIDIDGVVLHGGKPFEWSKEAIHTLWTNEIPFMFVTNGTYSSANLVNQLSKILELPFTNDHVVVAPSPCTSLVEYHDKHVLACCQEDSIDLISELGFTSYVTIPELVEIFPELDFVDHNKRIELMKKDMTKERRDAIDKFKPIEAILLLGEPINWECALQVLIDILMTNGDPRSKFKYVPCPHLPIIACNKDITFKGAAALPRFGHGAFLECLEALYMKITRNELVYEQLMGKPFLVTYEYAANKMQKLSKNGQPINKFYIIGDNPDVDIQGANMYKEHLLSVEQKRYGRRASQADLRSVAKVESILVCTGVYNPQNDLLFHLSHLFESQLNEENDNHENLDDIKEDLEKHELRDAMSRKNSFISYFDNKYNVPDLTVNNLLDAVQHIITDKLLNQ